MAMNGVNTGIPGMQSILAADSAMKQTKVHAQTKEEIEGRMNVLEAEIKLDSGNGGNVEAKKKELEELQERIDKLNEMQAESMKELNERIEDAKDRNVSSDKDDNTPYHEAATVEISDEGREALEADRMQEQAAAEADDEEKTTFAQGNTDADKSENVDKVATDKKLSAEERAKVIEELKRADEAKQQQLIDMIRKMFDKQGIAYNNSNKWRMLASGNYKVDSATAARASADIGEDGYWGVKQTSQRLYDFAYAYAGDDIEKMRTMEKAMEKGFKLAGGQWGKKLPGICYATMDAAREKFKQYYSDHGVNTDNK